MATAKKPAPEPKDELTPEEVARVSAALAAGKAQETEGDDLDLGDSPPDKGDPPKPPRSVGARIRDVEKRHGKDFEHILLDLHDHIFGTSPEHNESDDPEPKDETKTG